MNTPCTKPVAFGPALTICDNGATPNRYDASETIRWTRDKTAAASSDTFVQKSLKKVGATSFTGLPLKETGDMLNALYGAEQEIMNGLDATRFLDLAEQAANSIGEHAQEALLGHLRRLRTVGYNRADSDLRRPAIGVLHNNRTGQYEPAFAKGMAGIIRNDNALADRIARLDPETPQNQALLKRREHVVKNTIRLQMAILYAEAARAAMRGRYERMMEYLYATDHGQFTFPFTTEDGHSLREARDMQTQDRITGLERRVSSIRHALDTSPADAFDTRRHLRAELETVRTQATPFLHQLEQAAVGFTR